MSVKIELVYRGIASSVGKVPSPHEKKYYTISNLSKAEFPSFPDDSFKSAFTVYRVSQNA